MKHLKQAFMFALLLLTVNLIGYTAHAEGGTGDSENEQASAYEVCGTLTVGKNNITHFEEEYYSLTVEKTGWYTFTSGGGLSWSDVTIEDFVEITENGEKHSKSYSKTNHYLTAGRQYYAKFNVLSELTMEWSEKYHEDYESSEELTEYDLTISEYSGVTVTNLEIKDLKSESVEHIDRSYFAGMGVLFTYSDSTTDCRGNSNHKGNVAEFFDNHNFVCFAYLENDRYSSGTTTDLPAGHYTGHVRMGEFDITYPYEVKSYKDAGCVSLSEGVNNADTVHYYTFVPQKSGQYVFAGTDGKNIKVTLVEAENGDYLSPAAEDEKYISFELNAGTTYLLRFNELNDQKQVELYLCPKLLSAEGIFDLETSYLAEPYSKVFSYSIRLVYDNGESFTITDKERYDKYTSHLSVKVFDKDKLLYTEEYGGLDGQKPGTYRFEAYVGDLLVESRELRYVNASEYAKNLEHMKLNETKYVNAWQIYAFVAPEDNRYDCSSGYWWEVGKEREDGIVEWMSTTDNPEPYNLFEAGKTYLLKFSSSGEAAMFVDHDYKNNICLICGQYEQLETPTVTKVENTTSGAKVTWNKVENARLYRVYRKSGSGSWVRLTETGSASYVDTEAPAGKTCFYTVRCVSADGKKFVSDYDHKGISNIYLESPTLTLTNAMTGMTVKWDQVTGATGYYVYRKPNGGSYTRIANVTSGSTVSYTDSKPESGTTYTYAVRAYSGDYMSWYIPNDVVCLSGLTPTLTNKAAGTYISWTKVTGASGYYVYRKTGSGSYSKIATVTGTNYTDKNVTSGTSYTYAVRAYYGSTRGAYTGKTIKYLSAITPKLYNNTSGIKVTWTKVTGASGYYVYRKTGSGSYSKIKTITSGSTLYYTDTAVRTKKGTTYTYAVRAYNGNYLGNYTGVSLTRK